MADKNHIKEAARKRKLLINFLKNKKKIDFKKLQAFINFSSGVLSAFLVDTPICVAPS